MTLDEFRAELEKRAAADPRDWSIRPYGKGGWPWIASANFVTTTDRDHHNFVRIIAHDRDGKQGVEFECATLVHDAVVNVTVSRTVDVAHEDLDKILSMFRDVSALIQSHVLASSTRAIPSMWANCSPAQNCVAL